MGKNIIQKLTPERRELKRKRTELEELQDILTDHELDFATLEAELKTFESRYFQMVGIPMAELDDLKAEIAQILARRMPKDKEAQEVAQQASSQAETSARESGFKRGESQKLEEPEEKKKFKPSAELKKLYREVAKSVHPDLATDEEERAQREELMKAANKAYKERDMSQLESILEDWEISPDRVKGEGIAAELVRVIRKIEQIKKRIQEIKDLIEKLRKSELGQLMRKAQEMEEQGRDLLEEMRSRIKNQIENVETQLWKMIQ